MGCAEYFVANLDGLGTGPPVAFSGVMDSCQCQLVAQVCIAQQLIEEDRNINGPSSDSGDSS